MKKSWHFRSPYISDAKLELILSFKRDKIPVFFASRKWQPTMVAVDVTAFWRPALKDCPSKHYNQAAQRALPAFILGICGAAGEVNGQRMALPRLFERVHPKDPSEARVWVEMLKKVKTGLQADEIAVIDAGMKISDLQAAGLERYELRLAVTLPHGATFYPNMNADASQSMGQSSVRSRASTKTKHWQPPRPKKSTPGRRTGVNCGQRFGVGWY